MYKKIILAFVFVLLTASVSAYNICKDGPDLTPPNPYYMLPIPYHPSGFNPSSMPDNKQCWCNIETEEGVRYTLAQALLTGPFAELVPPADSGHDTIPITDYTSEYDIPEGTVLNIIDVGYFPNMHSQVVAGETPLIDIFTPVVDIVIKKINYNQGVPYETELVKVNNSRNCDHAEQSCYNIVEPHTICTGDDGIPSAYTFSEEGEYIVEIKPYMLNNGDERSAEVAATLNITVSDFQEPPEDPCADEYCGNGICNLDCDEDWTCSDCVNCDHDGICEPGPPNGENSENCNDDCPILPASPPAPTQGLLVISNSNPYRIIEVNDDADEVLILWTLTNTGDADVLLTSVGPQGCTASWDTPNGVGICDFLDKDLLPVIILGKSNIRVYEKITITDKLKIPTSELFGLAVTYTDTHGENEKTVTTSNNTVTLSYAFSERRKFQVELRAGKPRYCLGGDGQVGGTGEGMAPRVKFDWDWSSWGGGIKKEGDSVDASVVGNMMSCDKEGPNDKKFYFCDPTQFTITVMEKLMLLEDVIENYQNKELIDGKGQGEELRTYLKQFQVYLIGDNYNEDFKKDFVAYYVAGYTSGNAPSEFYNLWYKYLEEDNRLEFVNSKNGSARLGSGLYNVRINVTFDKQYPGKFFISDKPTANVIVELTKSPEYSAPLNPLYYMPFNGNVGIDNPNGRNNYGMSYIYTHDQPLTLNEKDGLYFELRSGTSDESLYTVETEIRNEFKEVNQTNRGALLTIKIGDEASAESGANGRIIFSPSKATPVFVGAISDGSEASFYYYITKNGMPLSGQSSASAGEFITYWTGHAATYNCADFEGKNLPLNRADSRHPSNGNKCTGNLTINEKSSAFGFNWSGFVPFEPDPKIVLFTTIFYTPDEQAGEYQLHNACHGNLEEISVILEETNAIFFAPAERNSDGLPSSGAWLGFSDISAIPLEYSSLNTENTDGTKTIQQVFDLIEEERACLTVENTDGKFEMKVWWNPAKLINETAIYWDDQVESGSGNVSKISELLKKEQLQNCGRT